MIHETIKTRVVGVDIEIDTTTLAVIDVRGDIIASESFNTGTNPNIGDFASVLSERVVTLVENNGGYESIRSLGICCPSANYMTSCIENAPNLPWKGVVPLAAMMRDRLGLAVALGNNAYARGLGELAFGVAHGMKNFVLMTLGGGVGSCIFVNGQYYPGGDGFAGEIGHSLAHHDGRQCGCGNSGCLEMYCSRKGILLTAQEVMSESDKPSKMRLTEDLTPEIIVSFCEMGDELAIETMRRTGDVLGSALSVYATIINPEAFIFTGSVSHLGDWLFDPAWESFNDHVFHNIKGKVKFLSSQFDEKEANMLGASVLAWSVKEYSLFK
ncbi:MAG: ROK family protein [Prevotella sp.]|nr:ROK family protein [Prevotella sp.]